MVGLFGWVMLFECSEYTLLTMESFDWMDVLSTTAKGVLCLPAYTTSVSHLG